MQEVQVWDAYQAAAKAVSVPQPKSAMASVSRHHARLQTERLLVLLAEAQASLETQRWVRVPWSWAVERGGRRIVVIVIIVIIIIIVVVSVVVVGVVGVVVGVVVVVVVVGFAVVLVLWLMMLFTLCGCVIVLLFVIVAASR